jgi:hypothetical protein
VDQLLWMKALFCLKYDMKLFDTAIVEVDGTERNGPVVTDYRRYIVICLFIEKNCNLGNGLNTLECT